MNRRTKTLVGYLCSNPDLVFISDKLVDGTPIHEITLKTEGKFIVAKHSNGDYECPANLSDQREWREITYKYKKPPLGISPAFTYADDRKQDIIDAIDRFHKAGTAIPCKWIEEYNLLNKILGISDFNIKIDKDL